MPAVIVRLPADDSFFAGIASCAASCQHCRLGPRGHEADLIGAGNEVMHPFAPLQLRFNRLAEMRPIRRGFDESFDHGRMSMAQQERSGSHAEIDVLIAVHIPFPRSLATS